MRCRHACTCVVYTDLIISTIVDVRGTFTCEVVYTDLIISTIVDKDIVDKSLERLYGLDNFYYRRSVLFSYLMLKSIRT